MNGRSIALATTVLGGLAATTASAQENFYASKTIHILVGVAPGGGTDVYARLLAQHLGKNIPGSPVVIVQNNGSAAGVVAIQSLDTIGPQDGTLLVTFNPGLMLTSVVTPDKIKLNFADYAWLGNIGDQKNVCFMSAASGVKTWDDLLKKDPVIMGDTGGGGGTFIQQKVLQQMFGVKLKQVSGYRGGGEKNIALERGELDGDCSNWVSIPPDWLNEKKINLVVRFSPTAPEGLPANIPYIGDLTNDLENKRLLQLLDSPNAIGRPYIMSKAVPADRMKLLRDGFDKTMADPQFIGDAAKAKLPIAATNGVKVEEMVKAITSASPKVVAEAKTMIGD
jgi:tripartite-type tricarboxylate transporter receptor subunit TctC